MWRPATGTWFILRSSGGYQRSSALVVRWGAATDQPVPADYDGDGRADLAVWRPGTGTWWILTSTSGFRTEDRLAVAWGSGRLLDVPVPADYDGDGRADLAVAAGTGNGGSCSRPTATPLTRKCTCGGASARWTMCQCRRTTTATGAPTWLCGGPAQVPAFPLVGNRLQYPVEHAVGRAQRRRRPGSGGLGGDAVVSPVRRPVSGSDCPQAGPVTYG